MWEGGDEQLNNTLGEGYQWRLLTTKQPLVHEYIHVVEVRQGGILITKLRSNVVKQHMGLIFKDCVIWATYICIFDMAFEQGSTIFVSSTT